ncbi:MAG: aconitase X [Candidatus Tritonobacter lacicola]|nr:aconitase X [Candidatus Tritonobacter lacicola]
MNENQARVLKGITRIEGSVEGEALVTTEFLSHLVNAIDSNGVVRIFGHPLQGQSYADKVIVYDTDKFSTGGAWGLYFKNKITGKGPRALICRTVHPISVGGAVDAEIPAVDHFEADPCETIKSGDWVRISAPTAGREAIVEIFPNKEAAAASGPFCKTPDGEAAADVRGGWKKSDLVLSNNEQAMLDGKQGEAKKMAMERLVAFAHGMGSRRMVPIRSAHVFSDLKTNELTIGAWPIFEQFAKLGARVIVPTTVESTFMAEEKVDDPRMPWHYKVKTPAEDIYNLMKPVHDDLRSMGAMVIPTCIPYMHLNVPRFGEYHVTSESNHAANANIMSGARVNRDPANIAFYAAITGVMPEYGMHLPENRRGQMIFEIEPEVMAELQDVGDYVALGGAIGFRAVDRVPVVVGIKDMTNAQAKAFCACVSPALLYPMIHVVGITPEARTIEDAFGGTVPEGVEKIQISRKDVAAVFKNIRQTDNPEIDAAVIGCPFLTIQELSDLAEMLKGKQVKKTLWLYTDYIIYSAARKAGIIRSIEECGAVVVHSCCPGMVDRAANVAEQLVFATDSLKVASLMSGSGWPKNWLGTRQEVIDAALTGTFRRKRWMM